MFVLMDTGPSSVPSVLERGDDDTLETGSDLLPPKQLPTPIMRVFTAPLSFFRFGITTPAGATVAALALVVC
jgi:hypothetical protein